MRASCPQCGYENSVRDPVCGLCQTVLVPASAADDPFQLSPEDRLPEPVPEPEARIRVPVGWVYLALGAVFALVFTLTPALRFAGWLFGSLFHETGHVAFAWFVGCPAWPAISLAGHAAAFHKPQSGMILLFIGAILAIATWQAWQRKRFRGLATGLLIAWPIFAFLETPRDLGFLLSGHLGELVFAGIFIWRARTGEAIQKEAERPFYACLGWFLVARNVVLCFGLTFTESARAWYMSNGSFGLTNDYARVALHVLHVPLQVVAAFMLIVSAAVIPVVLAMTWTPQQPAGRMMPAWRNTTRNDFARTRARASRERSTTRF